MLEEPRASSPINRSPKSRKRIKLIATGVENASQKFRGIVYDRALKVNRWWYVTPDRSVAVAVSEF